MLVDAKPPLDEDILLHYGIPGMKWGQRHDYIPIGGQRGGGGAPVNTSPARRAAPVNTASGRRGAAPSTNNASRNAGAQRQGMSTGKKVAIGVGIVGGAAAAAYFISKTGTRPSAASMTSRSNAAGLRMTMGVLKRSGKVGVSTIKGTGKVAKVTGKVGFKTGKVIGKGVGKAGKTVATNSASTAREFISALKKEATASGPSKVSGEKFGKLLLGEYGPKGFSSGGGLAYVPTQRPRLFQESHGSE